MDFVVYAEGTTEAGLGWRSLPSPGQQLKDEQQGPLHTLIRRSVGRALSTPSDEIRFLSPLRRSDGAVARGSDLLRPKTIAKLLTWSGLIPAPDVAVLLVDQDDDEERIGLLRAAISGLPFEPLTAVGVAVKEFEAWLAADHACLRAVFGDTCELLERPHACRPGEAKQYLARVHATSGAEEKLWQARHRICRTADLEAVGQRCTSFREFESDLKRAGLRAQEARRNR